MLTLEPRYYGSVDYYALMASHRQAAIAVNGLFDKRRKSTHRCLIADGKGSTLTQTMPIVKPHGIDRARWTDVGISTHGHWWTAHRESLATAYGRTPFFEYYIDRFTPFLSAGVEQRFGSLAQMCLAIDTELRRILLIDTEIIVGADGLEASGTAADEEFDATPYYQPWAPPFVPHLSVLDLIFNLGPEAALYLRRLSHRNEEQRKK